MILKKDKTSHNCFEEMRNTIATQDEKINALTEKLERVLIICADLQTFKNSQMRRVATGFKHQSNIFKLGDKTFCGRHNKELVRGNNTSSTVGCNACGLMFNQIA